MVKANINTHFTGELCNLTVNHYASVKWETRMEMHKYVENEATNPFLHQWRKEVDIMEYLGSHCDNTLGRSLNPRPSWKPRGRSCSSEYLIWLIQMDFQPIDCKPFWAGLKAKEFKNREVNKILPFKFLILYRLDGRHYSFLQQNETRNYDISDVDELYPVPICSSRLYLKCMSVHTSWNMPRRFRRWNPKMAIV